MPNMPSMRPGWRWASQRSPRRRRCSGTGLIGQRFESLDRLREGRQGPGCRPRGRKRLPEIRNHAIAALCLTDLRVRSQQDSGPVFGIGVDCDLKRYAVAERTCVVVVRGMDDGRELFRLPAPDHVDYTFAVPGFSPYGALLLVEYQSNPNLVRVWNPESRELLGSLPTRGAMAFHPDGRRLLFMAPEGGIGIWDIRQRRVVRRLSLDFTPSVLALDREGRRLAVNSTDTKGAAGRDSRARERRRSRRLAIASRGRRPESRRWATAGRRRRAGRPPPFYLERRPRGAVLGAPRGMGPIRALGPRAGDRRDPTVGRGFGRAPWRALPAAPKAFHRTTTGWHS